MTVKPIFMRPIEITTPDVLHFRIQIDEGAGLVGHNIVLDVGVWGSVFNLAGGIAAEITALHANWTCTASMVDSSGDVRIKFVLVDSGASGTAPVATWSGIYDTIGAVGGSADDEVWTESPSDTWTSTMTYRPTHTWVPTYQSAEQGRFHEDPREVYKGNMAASGFLSGNDSGPSIYWRELVFVNDTAENLFASAATSSTMPSRALDYFSKHCRTANVTVSGNPCVRGFYFFPDWNDVLTTCSNLTDDSGGIHFDYSSSPDTFVFCQMDSSGHAQPAPSLPTTKTRYTTGMTIHTVDYTVTWTYYVEPV